MDLIAFRLFPVGPALVGEDAIIAHDTVWHAAKAKCPELPVRFMSELIGCPDHASEYARLCGVLYGMLGEAQDQGIAIPHGGADIDTIIARASRADRDRATGQVSFF